MAVTVIDQLIVKLGLDPRDFTKGEKEVAASVLRTKKTVEDASRGMNESVKDGLGGMNSSFITLAKRASVIALLAFGLKKLVESFADVSRATRQLGNDARNYDIAAAKLRNFQNVAEMMGGNAEDATKTISGLQRAIFNLTYNGAMSDQLVMLGRLGVQFQDASGHARDFKDVYLDTAAAIEQQRATGGMTEGEAFQYLQAAGYDPGLARAALGGRASAQALLDRQGERRQVTGEDVSRATEFEQSLTSLGQAKEAAKLIELKAAPAASGAMRGAEHVLNVATGQEPMGEALTAFHDTLTPLTTSLGDAADAVKSFTSSLRSAVTRPSGRYAYEPTIQAAAKKHGINPEMLAGLIQAESNFNPNAVNPKSGATGIAQLLPKYFKGAGNDPYKDIDTAAGELRRLHDSFVKSGDADDDGAWFLAQQAYNAGETRFRKSDAMTPGGKPLSQETLDYPSRVMAGAASSRSGTGGGGSSTTTVDVGDVNIYTQATDADGIAEGAAGALKRKLSASHAEQGMQ